MDQFEEQEEIKVGGLKLQDLDQFIANAEEELNKNSFDQKLALDQTARVNYVESPIIDG